MIAQLMRGADLEKKRCSERERSSKEKQAHKADALLGSCTSYLSPP